jgi:ABC-type amino acid transport substrate-binding protein
MRETEGMGVELQPLRVGAALPDPPFEFMTGAGPTGFDVAPMQRIASQLGRPWQLIRYTGADFNGIFAGLDEGIHDRVASGATITPDRERLGVCVRKGDTVLRDAIGNAQAVLIRNGTLPALIGQWLGAGATAAP